MKYETIPPPPELAAYVRFFWVLECDASPDKPYVHRSMADGCAELIFHYNGQFDELTNTQTTEKSFTSGIHGQSQFFRRFIIKQNFGIFGVYLFPYAIPVFFSVPAPELSNQMPDLFSFLGNEGKELEEKIGLAANTTQRVDILITYLKKKLTKSSLPPPAVFATIKNIIQNKGFSTVQELAGQTCLSTRQFERNFKAFSGFTPKLYSRIIRFQAALNEYGNHQKTLTEIGLSCGYFDQSHFIHEFKTFSGYHPGLYFSGRSKENAYKDA